MKSRVFDPLRLDVEAFAREAVVLDGRWPVAELPRLLGSLAAIPPGAEVVWQAAGRRRSRAGAEPETWLELRAQARLTLQCQRCLAPLQADVQFDRRFRFVRDEAAAEALDAEIDDDVLATTRSFDLRALVEDELLLALPLVPRHERCPQPLPAAVDSAGDEPAEAPRRNPFGALAGWRPGGPAGSDEPEQ